MKNIKDNILQEQTDDNLDFELGMQMSSLGPIPKSKKQAAAVIKRIFNSSDQSFYGPGDNISLDTDLKKIKDKIRFFEYGKSFQSEKEGRGFNFEGMLAGLFNGTPIVSKAKEDITVGDRAYSIKTSEPGSSFDSGTLIFGFRNELDDMEEDGVNTTDITTPYQLLKKEGQEYNQYKRGMLTSMFTTSDGKSLDWIFSVVYPNYIEYTVWSSNELIDAIITNPDMLGVGRSPNTDVRIKSRFVMQNPSIIQFPSFTPDELKRLRYVEDRGLKLDKIAELFGKYKTKVRYDVLQYIRKNPATFLKRIVNLYGDRLGPILKEKGFVELNESINYDDTKVQNLIIDILYEGVGGDEEWHTGDQGDFFTLAGTENLGNTDMFKDDGFDIIHQYMGDVHLSDLSPEEEETIIPKGSKKVKKTVLKPNLKKGPYNTPVTEDFQIDPEKGHYGYIFSDKLPIDVDNKLYVLSNKLGDLTHEEISKFADRAAEQEIHVLQGLLYKFPSTLQEMVYYYGGLDTLRKSVEYQRIINIIRSVGNRDYLTEDIDIFGQGLGEPIDPEEFEGDEKEWEELVSDVGDDEFEVEPEYDYEGGKTDPSKGFVAPSAEVTNNICKVKGFCTSQGPITFGQLRELVETATSKRIQADMGRGVFKTLWRVIPFFIPQVLLAAVGITVTRAINKIITPALKDTQGYKSWWGKVVLKAMDIAEGDYIPDVALGDDPLSKIFFISDGLLQMIRDKYKLKFARYVAEVAASKPDNEPVPEWFVENLLRDYLNQKFLLNPPLPIKTDVEKTELEEDLENWGYQDNKIGVVENFDEEGYKKDKARLQQTINNYLDSEYEITFIGNMYGNKEVMRFKSNRTGEILTPHQILSEIDNLFGGGELADDKAYPIDVDEVLYYLKYLAYKKKTIPNISFQIDEDRTPNYPGSPDSFRSLHRDRVNDDKLQIPPATLVNYLDKYHREKLIKEITPSLECIAYNCYEGWKNDSDNLNPENTEEVADQYCDECGEGLLDTLGLLDREVVKMGFVTTSRDGHVHTGVPSERRVNDYPIVDVLEKPFPFTYNDWLENIIQEVDPKFFINTKDDIVYMEDITETLNEQSDSKEHNPDVEVGDVIELIYMDDPWADIGPMTRGIVTGFESMGSLGEKVLVKWIMSTEEGNEKFRDLPLIKGVDYWRRVNPLREHIIPTGDEEKPDFDYERFGNIMVRAYFSYSGGWGQPAKRFVVYITPSGIVKGVSLNVGMSNREVPFKEGDKVSLGELIKFEKNSKFDLQMKGRIREGLIKEQILPEEELSEMTPKVWKIVQMALKVSAGSTMFQDALRRYFTISETDSQFLWLVVTANAKRLELNTTELLNVNYDKIKVPTLWETTIEYLDDYNEDEMEEDCVDGYGEESGESCDCLEFEELEETTTDKDGDKSEEWVSCWEATKATLEKYGYDTADECECEDWETMYTKKYYYPIRQATIISHDDLQDEHSRKANQNDTYHTIVGELDDWGGLVTEDEHWEDNYDEQESWDYFDDHREGEVELIQTEDLDTAWMMQRVNRQFYNVPKNLQEQEGEQLKMFTTGQWNFPVSGLEEMEMKYVEEALPEQIVTKIFKIWDEKGIDFSILKLLGIEKGFALLQTMLLKRYLQFTTTPIPVSYTLDCDELKELFNTNSQDYEMDYVKEYLCGEDSFWESEDWYNYEWESYMTDAIDEKNWKTISQIFGGVSQSVAEDILTRSSSSEEVDELTDKYDEEIDEIQNYIVWANSDETEYATKSAMAKDIREKIEDHFDGTGRLMRDDKGSFNYIIDGDLKDYVNDIWDNTEDVFEYHQEYSNQTLEDVILDLGKDYMKPSVIFGILMDEEYRFWDYCEGKKGDCLETEQKFFEGYWMPDIDINESLADRLGELTYEPEEVTEPIQEQDEEGWVVPVRPVDKTKDENQNIPTDDTPFTALDVKILNRLATMFDKDTLASIWEEDESQLGNSVYQKYENIMKLYGEKSKSEWSFARSTRFAKWADDNWDEAERIKEIELGDDYDDTITYDIDFGLVTNPIKDWPHEYEVEATESYWAKEYRYGSTIVPAYGEENAEHRANSAWWDGM